MVLLLRVCNSVFQSFQNTVIFTTVGEHHPKKLPRISLSQSPLTTFNSLHPLSPLIHFLALGIFILDTLRRIEVGLFVTGGFDYIFAKFFCVVTSTTLML